MQGNPQSARLNRMPLPATMLGHMPYHPEAAYPDTREDKIEAIRQENRAAALLSGRVLDSAVLIVKSAAP